MSCSFARCQFPEEAIVAFNDAQWCPFHLPLQSSHGPQTLPSPKLTWSTQDCLAFEQRIYELLTHSRPDAPADLRGVVFPRELRVEALKRGLHADFSGAVLCANSSFAGAIFESHVSFDSATIGDDVRFSAALFKGGASFENARLGDRVNFDGAAFDGWTSFRRAILGNRLSFSNATFARGVSFAGGTEPAAATVQHISFRAADFDGYVTFNNRQFLNSVSFDGATFRTAPAFHNVQFHKGTSFNRTVFQFTRGATDAETSRAEAAYRTLRQAMEDVRSRENEELFFALELECKRQRRDCRGDIRFLTLLYKLTADYGRSVIRPVSILAGMTALTIITLLALTPRRTITEIVEIGRFVAQQTVAPFSVFSSDYQPVGLLASLLTTYTVTVLSISFIHSFVVLSAFALVVIALRRRFTLS